MQRTKSDADEGKINKRASLFATLFRVASMHALKLRKRTPIGKWRRALQQAEKKIQSERSRDKERKRKFAPTTSLFGAFLRSKITVESGFGFCALLLALACSFLIGFCSCSSASVAIFSFASV